jgi:hypothetical protein
MDLKASGIDFGKWLRKTNARAVLACLIAALLSVSGLWSYSLMSEVKTNYAAPHSSGRQAQQNLPLGVLSAADTAEKTIAQSFPSVSPFAGAPAVPRERHHPANIEQPKMPINTFIEKFRKNPPEDIKEPRLDRPETISLTYKGIFRRSDGIKMALIANSKAGKSAFYEADDDIFGLKLKNIETETIEVLQADGQPLKLSLDQPAVFVEGKHAP